MCVSIQLFCALGLKVTISTLFLGTGVTRATDYEFFSKYKKNLLKDKLF